MQITLYRNTQHYKKVDKRGGLTPVVTVECAIKDDVDMLHPVLYMDASTIGEVTGINYMYIPYFGRYYFVKIDTLTGGVAQLNGSVDPLQSNANDLLRLRCTVARQEYNYNMELPDSDIPVIAKRNITIKNFSVTPFSSNPSGRHYVMTVSGASALQSNIATKEDDKNAFQV